MKLLDSTFIIDLLHKNEEALKKAKRENDTKLFFTDLNIYEVSLGIYHLDKPKSDMAMKAFRELVQNLYYLPLTTEASFKSAQIKANLMKRGVTIDDIDCIMVAIALLNKVNTIITRNIKHFSVIDKIKVEPY